MDPDRVSAERERRGSVEAGPAGGESAQILAAVGVGYRDMGATDAGPAGISDGAADASGDLLGIRGEGGTAEEQERNCNVSDVF